MLLNLKRLQQSLCLVLFSIFLSCSTDKPDDGFRMPGEFEPQQAVWLGWEGHDPYYPVNKDMIDALLPYVKLKVVSESDSILSICKSYLTKGGTDTSKIEFHVMPNNEFWMRDHGATFVKNARGEMKVVDFEWCTYGYREWLMARHANNKQVVDSILSRSRASKRGSIDSMMAVQEGIGIVKSWLKIEGGAIEVNGAGTLLLNEPLTLSRNAGIPKDSIEAEFKRVLGVTNVIWLQEGLAEDPHIWQTINGKFIGIGTGGHTDEYVKFADAHTILLAWIDEKEKDDHPLNKINYERMKINYEILNKAKDQNGEPFNIVKMPLPAVISRPIKILAPNVWEESYNVSISVLNESDGWKVGDTAYRVAASSYLNFYVTNGMVLIPSYLSAGASPQKEEEVRKIFEKVFPGRKLVFIDSMPLNWEGGGIHCGTQQQPSL